MNEWKEEGGIVLYTKATKRRTYILTVLYLAYKSQKDTQTIVPYNT